ncbi:MAG TPA: monovalent cation/H+ antiporter complex subunit F [Myxococcaceae bacterium]|nr:monovalent cation/H+ antiporter complex subunit F [Myxococcaceae bacterium]
MSMFLFAVSGFLLVTELVVLGWLLSASASADRLLSSGLLGSLSMALLLLLAEAGARPWLYDAVLVLAVLGAVAVSLVAARLRSEEPKPQVARERVR